MIRLEDVRKCYGRQCVLEGIRWHVPPGALVAVMGSSGSGKSTLLNLVGAMDLPDDGRIVVDGEEISAYKDAQRTLYRRRKVGFVFQAFNLLPHITVFENIELPLLLNGIGDGGGRVRELIGLVGLADKEAAPPFELSGGEQQRVAIARALIHDPAIVLADEPTGNLDRRTGQAVMELIASIARERRKTVVLVTHDPAVARFAETTFELKDGMLHS